MRGTAITVLLLSVVVPAQAGLVITEILANPSAVSDSYGEWFEVYNDGPASIDMYGYGIADLDSDAFEVTAHVVVPAGGFALFGRSGDFSMNGGVTIDYAYGSAMSLANASDELVIYDDLGALVDEVIYTPGTNDWPAMPNGASMYYDWCGDNSDGACWFVETEYTFGWGDHGTPGYDPRLPSNTDQETWSSIKALYKR